MSDIADQSGGWRGRVALGALVVSILSVLWFMAAALGSRFGFWSWQFGLLTMMRDIGRVVAFGSVGLAVIALVIALIKSPRKRPAILAIGALVVSLLLLGRLGGLVAGAQAVPPIHDIQTDWSDPVRFSEAIIAARGPESNPVRYGTDAVFSYGSESPLEGRLIADIQEEAECPSKDPDDCEDAEPPKPYPPLEPVTINAAPDVVFAAAKRLVAAQGWTIVTEDAEGGVLEATHTSTWFGFKDDVALRLRPVPGGTRVDMRSVSRVGRSDLGANSRRISAFLNDLEGQRY